MEGERSETPPDRGLSYQAGSPYVALAKDTRSDRA
jgi:hypothetical protein